MKYVVARALLFRMFSRPEAISKLRGGCFVGAYRDQQVTEYSQSLVVSTACARPPGDKIFVTFVTVQK